MAIWKKFSLNIELRMPSGKVVNAPLRHKARSADEAIKAVRTRLKDYPSRFGEILSVRIAEE